MIVTALREQMNNAAALLQDLAATSYLTHISQRTAHTHIRKLLIATSHEYDHEIRQLSIQLLTHNTYSSYK